MFQPFSNRNVIRAPRVLLLQGPVGPFFRDLHQTLAGNGFDVNRVVFNAADQLFAPRHGTVTRFSGAEEAWANWLRNDLANNPTDFVVLFGAMRPAHQIAREVADEFGVTVMALEEGYLRSGYITCETGGNNQHSALCNWPSVHGKRRPVVGPVKMRSSFARMSTWGILYYLTRDLFSKRTDDDLFHRKRESIIGQSLSWITHMAGRASARATEFTTCRRLKGSLSGQYILVTLQMPGDSQLKTAGRGWSNQRLVKETLRALRRRTDQQIVVFKVHPLDRKALRTTRLIKRMARELGVSKRIIILQTGAIGEIARHSSGMIAINSTSGFSALHHNVPILVMGDAIYRHESLVTPGTGPQSIDTFLNARATKCPEQIQQFFDTVKSSALLPGDFYASTGRAAAAEAIAKDLSDNMIYLQFCKEAAE